MTTRVEQRPDGTYVVVQSGEGDYNREGRIVGWTFSDANRSLIEDQGSRDNFDSVLGGTTWCWPSRTAAVSQAEDEHRRLFHSEEGDDPMPTPEWKADEHDLEMRWDVDGDTSYLVYPVILYVREG